MPFSPPQSSVKRLMEIRRKCAATLDKNSVKRRQGTWPFNSGIIIEPYTSNNTPPPHLLSLSLGYARETGSYLNQVNPLKRLTINVQNVWSSVRRRQQLLEMSTCWLWLLLMHTYGDMLQRTCPTLWRCVCVRAWVCVCGCEVSCSLSLSPSLTCAGNGWRAVR